MSKQPGRNVIVRLGDGGSPTEAFTEIGRMTLRRLYLRQAPVEVTDQDSPSQWRELLARGVKSARIDIGGAFKDSAQERALQTHFFARTTPNMEFLLPSWGTISGAFLIAELESEGRLEDDAAVRSVFESAGELTFVSE